MTNDLRLSDFPIYHTSDAILGHISLSIEICRSSWSCMIISTYEIHIEKMTCLLSYHDPLVEPLLGHSVRPTLWYLDILMLLLLGDASLMFGPESVVDLDDWDYTFDDGWFEVIQFSNLPYIYAILGHISFSIEIYRIFMESHDLHHSRDVCRVDSLLLSYHDPPVESFLGHSVRLTLFSI